MDGVSYDEDRLDNAFAIALFFVACSEGQIDAVQELLDYGVPVNIQDQTGNSPLSYTAMNGHVNIVQMLISRGALVDLEDNSAWTPLMYTSRFGFNDVAVALIQDGANINQQNSSGETPLIIASRHRQANIVRLLLDNGGSVDLTRADGATPLLVASQEGYADMVAILLENEFVSRPVINTAMLNGATALHYACHLGHLEIVQLLVAYGASVDTPDNESSTPLIIASQFGHVEIVSCLLAHGARIDNTISSGHTALKIASEAGQLEVVKVLLERGASVDTPDLRGWTPLMAASQYGHTDIVSALTDTDSSNHAAINLQNQNGEGPLICAALEGHAKVVEILLMRGASIDMANEEGWTSLMRAAERGHLAVVEILLKKGANINARRPKGATALNIACEHGHFNVVVELVNHGASIDLADSDDYTPLITAAQLGFSEIVQFLVTRGANVNTRLQSGGTALITAVWYKRMAVVRILLENGADVRICGDFQSWPALTAAYFSGYSEIVQLIYEKMYDLPDVYGYTRPNQPNTQVDAKCRNGDTALRVACERGEYKWVEALVEIPNNDINIPNSDGFTPLMSASMNHRINIVALLLSNGVSVNQRHPSNGTTALALACEYNFPAIVRLLVTNGARVDLLDRECWGPLMIAARLGYTDVVEIILKEGKANIDQQLPNGTTALHIASQRNFLELVNLLLDYGACVDMPDRRGWTPLMSSACYGTADVVAALLKNGAQIDKQSLGGTTPLQIASGHGRKAIVQLLLENKARVDLPDKTGYTPLLEASERGHKDVAGILLERTVNIDKQIFEGETMLTFASAHGYLSTVKLLVENGACVDVPNSGGSTALMCASSSGHADVAAFLLENQGSIEQVVTGDTAVLSDVENGSLIIEQGESAGNDERPTSMTGSQLGPSTVVGAFLGVDGSTLCTEPRNPELCGIVVPKQPSSVLMDLLVMAFKGLRQIFELVDAIKRQRLQNRKTYLRMMQIYVKLQSGPLRVNPTVHCIQATERFVEVINMFAKYLQKYHAMHRVLRVFKWGKMEDSRIEVVDEVDRLFQMLNIEVTETATEGHAVAASNAVVLFSKFEDKRSEIRLTHDDIHTALLVDMLNIGARYDLQEPEGELQLIKEKTPLESATEVTNPDMLSNKTIELTELHRQNVNEEEEKQSPALIITDEGVGKDKLEPKIKPVVQAEEKMEVNTTFSPLLSSPSLLGDSSVPLLIKQLGSGEATTQETELALLDLISKCVSNSNRVQVYKAKGIPVLRDVVRSSESWLAQLYALHCLSWFTFIFSKVRESEFEELQEYVRVPMQSQTLSILHTLQYGNDQEKEVAALQCSCLATRGDGEILRQLKAFPLLIDLLTNGTANQKLWATEALVTLASDSDESCVEITSEGAIPSLITLLRSGTDMQKEEAAFALGNLAANDAATRAKIAREGAIPPIVEFVKVAVDSQNQGAVYALGFLSLNNEENRVLIAQEGAIPPLVELLKTGTREQKKWSAYTLGNLAYRYAIRVEITKQEAIGPLIELLRSGTAMQKQRAAFALGNLACDNDVGSEFDEAILPLVELVRVGSDTQKEDAAYTLGNMAASNYGIRDEIGRKGAISPLVELLRSGNDDQKQWAAFALRCLAHNNDKNRVAIIEEGAVPLLAALIEFGTDEQKEQAAHALKYLTENDRNDFGAERRMTPLMDYLRETSYVPLIYYLWFLKTRVAIVEEEADPPLPALVECGTDEQKEQAAHALKHLTENDRNDFGTERLMPPLMDYQRAGIASQTSNVPRTYYLGCLKPQRMVPLFNKRVPPKGKKRRSMRDTT